ncbi:MAG: hypothetical protein Q7K57_01430 [Burkholderiaceae bacterium]|nr:hypothetical protein [Burkholderiaceae bacterium]
MLKQHKGKPQRDGGSGGNSSADAAAEGGAGAVPENCPEDPCDLPEEDQEYMDSEEKPKPRESMLGSLGLILVVFALLQVMLFSPEIFRALVNMGKPDVRVFLGTVQKVTYVGGFGTSTQVDTENQTLLLRGAASFKLGAQLERRKGFWDTEVCELQTGACWDLKSQ